MRWKRNHLQTGRSFGCSVCCVCAPSLVQGAWFSTPQLTHGLRSLKSHGESPPRAQRLTDPQPAVPNAGAAAPPKPAVTQSENRSSPTLSNPRPAPAERAPAASDGNLVSRELVSRETTALPAGAEAGPTHATPIETPSRQTRHA